MSHERVAIITPSYRNDFDLAADLCRSIDEFVRFDYEHILVVPQSDFALFSRLAGPKRRVLTRESILKRHGFRKLPLPTIVRLPFLKPRRLREQYWLTGVGRVSGWLVQQIVKISAADFTDASLYVFADSDVVLVRPFELSMLKSGETVNLQQHVRGRELDSHRTWRANAHKLLGVTAPRDEHYNYIGQLIPWTRPTLLGLIARMEAVGRRPWRHMLAEMKQVSEYILYGEYVVEGLEGAQAHPALDMRLYNSVWSPDATIDAAAIAASTEPQHIALHIQSTNPIPVEERRAAIAAVKSGLDRAAPLS